MYLTVLRHAQPIIASGICYGQLDIEADPQATQLAALQFAQLDWPKQLILRTSPAIRCQALASAIQSIRPDFMIQTDARLLEMNFGSWEGIAWEHIAKQEIDDWVADFAHYKVGGGESSQMMLERVNSALNDYMRKAINEVWITHNGVLKSLLCIQSGHLNLSQAQDWPKVQLPFGQSYCLDLKPLQK